MFKIIHVDECTIWLSFAASHNQKQSCNFLSYTCTFLLIDMGITKGEGRSGETKNNKRSIINFNNCWHISKSGKHGLKHFGGILITWISQNHVNGNNIFITTMPPMFFNQFDVCTSTLKVEGWH